MTPCLEFTVWRNEGYCSKLEMNEMGMAKSVRPSLGFQERSLKHLFVRSMTKQWIVIFDRNGKIGASKST